MRDAAAAGSPPPDYRGQWDLFEVYCRDFYVAGRYAARQNWWLHCWKHVQAEHDDPRVVVVGDPQPPFVEVPDDGRTQAQRHLRVDRSTGGGPFVSTSTRGEQ